MRRLSRFLFVFGVVLATFLAVVAVWPDLEASLFDTAIRADERLENLNCPMVITPDEESRITSTLSNPFDRKVTFLFRIRISEGRVTMMRQINTMVEIETGDEQKLEWPIAAEDAAFGRIILARAHAFRSFPMPARDRSCGILVLNIPGLTGKQFVAVTLAMSLASLVGGAVLWLRYESPLRGRKLWQTRVAGLLTGLILAALVAGMLNSWLLGLLLLILTLLLLGITIERVLTSS